ncbi:MAG: ABC-F family ATP-binding cassette domain-containing protein [Bacteroidota bacterium]
MNYLSVENISKSYGDKQLFSNLSFGIDQGQKIALIGVNGSGKSTLFKILSGLEAPDEGKVSTRKGIRITFLNQEPDLPHDKTVGEIVFQSDHPSVKLIEEYERLTADPNVAPEKLEKITAEIAAAEAWDYEVKIKQILTRLQVDFLDTPAGALSGGQRKRVALAQALIMEPDLLIMDEPTNHLDLESIEWLEKFLASAKQSLLVVTHDRYFLDAITDEILELDGGNIYSYKGDYAYFLAQKAEREQLAEVNRERATSLYKKELVWLSRSPKARTTKSKSRIDAAHDLKEKTLRKGDDREMKLMVKGRRIGGKTLEIKNLRKSYGELNILDNFTYTFNRYDRVGVVGPNGVGKTTLLRLLVGEEEADSGKIRWGETIVSGYYKQDGWTFKDNARVIEVITEAAETVELSKSQTLSASQLLEHFLFPRHMHFNLVSTLSGGEKRRLHLLRILMTNPNFLILDEPTNDLDLITLRKLEEFLAEQYTGCLVVVTHDRYFMDRLVDHLFVFEGEGQLRDFPGSYSQFRKAVEKEEKAAAESKAKAPKEKKDNRPQKATENTQAETGKKRKFSYKEKREFESIETEIEQLEARKAELDELIASGETDYEKLTAWTQELEQVNLDLDTKSDRWLELMEILEG